MYARRIVPMVRKFSFQQKSKLSSISSYAIPPFPTEKIRSREATEEIIKSARAVLESVNSNACSKETLPCLIQPEFGNNVGEEHVIRDSMYASGDWWTKASARYPIPWKSFIQMAQDVAAALQGSQGKIIVGLSAAVDLGVSLHSGRKAGTSGTLLMSVGGNAEPQCLFQQKKNTANDGWRTDLYQVYTGKRDKHLPVESPNGDGHPVKIGVLNCLDVSMRDFHESPLPDVVLVPGYDAPITERYRRDTDGQHVFLVHDHRDWVKVSGSTSSGAYRMKGSLGWKSLRYAADAIRAAKDEEQERDFLNACEQVFKEKEQGKGRESDWRDLPAVEKITDAKKIELNGVKLMDMGNISIPYASKERVASLASRFSGSHQELARLLLYNERTQRSHAKDERRGAGSPAR